MVKIKNYCVKSTHTLYAVDYHALKWQPTTNPWWLSCYRSNYLHCDMLGITNLLGNYVVFLGSHPPPRKGLQASSDMIDLEMFPVQ